MAVFECNRCGKCCSSFGSFVTIERQLNDRDYYCRYTLNGDVCPVHVDAEYADEVAGRSETDSGGPAGKKPCPFLCREHKGAGFTCAIYTTRPRVCREFRCYRMQIYTASGQPAGTVIGANEIRTTDPVLARLWKAGIVPVPHAHPPGTNDPVWLRTVVGILKAHGYRGDAIE